MCVCLAGCFQTCGKQPVTPDVPPPRPLPTVSVDLKEQADKIGEVRDSVAEKANDSKTTGESIKMDALQGEKSAPAPQWQMIIKKVEKIVNNSDEIAAKVNELAGVQAKLSTAKAELKEVSDYAENAVASVEDLNSIIDAQEKKIRDYENGSKKQQQRIWMGVASLSAIGLVLGIFLSIYVSAKAGVGLVVGSIVLAPIAYFMAANSAIVSLSGGAIFLLFIGYLIYYLAKNRKALTESIISFELLKYKNWDESTKKEISIVQSDSTKKIISDIKLSEKIGK